MKRLLFIFAGSLIWLTSVLTTVAQQTDTLDSRLNKTDDKLIQQIDSLKQLQKQTYEEFERLTNITIQNARYIRRYIIIAIALLLLFTLAVAYNIYYHSTSYKEKKRKTLQRRNIIIEDLTLENAKLKSKWYNSKEQISELENLCKTLINNIPEAILITSRDGKMEYISPHAIEMFGFEDDEILIGNNIKQLLHQEYHELISKTIETIVVNPDKNKIRIRAVKKDNNCFDAQLQPAVLMDAHKEPSQVVFIISDISEYVQINNAVSLRNRYLDTFVNIQWYLSVFENDENYWSKILQLLGTSADSDRVYYAENYTDDNNNLCFTVRSIWAVSEELEENSIKQIKNEPYKIRFGRWLKALSEERTINTHVENMPPAEKKLFEKYKTISVLVVPLIINEKFQGFIGFENCRNNKGMDKMEITMLRTIATSLSLYEERKESKQKLRKSEEYFRALIQNSSDVISLIDKNGVTRYLSPSFEKITGWMVHERINRSGLELIHPDDRKKVENALKNIKHKTKTDRFEFRMKHKKGGWRFMETVSNNMLDHPAVESIVINYRDVTSRKNAEAVLRNSELRFKEASSTKDKLFSIIAHDLKNPFNTLLNISKLLIDNLNNYSKEQMRNLVNQINEASKSTFNLLENLLQWSRAQTNRIQYKPQNIRVKKMVGETINQLKNIATNKLIEIEYKSTENHIVYADADMMRTVTGNLITNAIKFTPMGGKITITAKKIELQNKPKPMIEIAVSDTGVGISEANINKLFSIDKTVHTSGTIGEQGTGLGLILCKEFVQRNNGNIEVESKIGKGSTFKFTLPEGTETDTTKAKVPDNKEIEIKKTDKQQRLVLAAKSIEKNSEVGNEIKHKLLPAFEANRQTIFFDKITGFADSAIDIGNKHNVDELIDYGKQLSNHAKNFDAESILKSFAEFEIFTKHFNA